MLPKSPSLTTQIKLQLIAPFQREDGGPAAEGVQHVRREGAALAAPAALIADGFAVAAELVRIVADCRVVAHRGGEATDAYRRRQCDGGFHRHAVTRGEEKGIVACCRRAKGVGLVSEGRQRAAQLPIGVLQVPW